MEMSDESSTLADRAMLYRAIAIAIRFITPSMKSAEFRGELSTLALDYEKLALAAECEMARLGESVAFAKIPDTLGA
jgi:hypothetical protein